MRQDLDLWVCLRVGALDWEAGRELGQGLGLWCI